MVWFLFIKHTIYETREQYPFNNGNFSFGSDAFLLKSLNNFMLYLVSRTCSCIYVKHIFKITIIWHNELFNGKGLKAKHMICVGLFHSNAGKNVIDNFS
jgi:hypothetical protein